MDRKTATLDEIFATFSEHISRSYPSPDDFRRNFDILLWGKRDRSDAPGYALSLERNIVYLDGVVEEALSLVERILDPGEDLDEKRAAAILGDLEKSARRSTGARHRRAFEAREDPAFAALAAGREAGGAGYVEDLEFNYRYLMTLRLFLFEFVSVLAAVRAEYDTLPAVPGDIARLRGQIGVLANYYLGNVSVKDGGDREAEARGEDAGAGESTERP